MDDEELERRLHNIENVQIALNEYLNSIEKLLMKNEELLSEMQVYIVKHQ